MSVNNAPSSPTHDKNTLIEQKIRESEETSVLAARYFRLAAQAPLHTERRRLTQEANKLIRTSERLLRQAERLMD